MSKSVKSKTIPEIYSKVIKSRTKKKVVIAYEGEPVEIKIEEDVKLTSKNVVINKAIKRGSTIKEEGIFFK